MKTGHDETIFSQNGQELKSESVSVSNPNALKTPIFGCLKFSTLTYSSVPAVGGRNDSPLSPVSREDRRVDITDRTIRYSKSQFWSIYF